EALAALGLAPSALIFSGGGHHVHLLIDFADQRKCDRLDAVYKRLVARLNREAGWELFGDESTDAGTRDCRDPGTLNVKYDPPRLATIIQNSGPTWTLEQLEQAAGTPEEATTEEPEADEQAEGEEQEAAVIGKVVALLLPYWKKSQRHTLSVSLSG